MLRKLAAPLAVLLVVAGLVAAQDEPDKKKDKKAVPFKTVMGTFESYKDEKLILLVDDKKRKFDVPGDTPVGYLVEKNKTKLSKAKDYLKDVKKGAFIVVTMDSKMEKVLALGVTEMKESPKEKTPAK
jgi:hypothetical protein